MDGCTKKVDSGGLCGMHRWRKRKYGDPSIVPYSAHGTLYERSLNKFVEGALDECWLWTGVLTHDGYGFLNRGVGQSNAYAHRVVFEGRGGVIPDGYELDHTCKIRNCVNPAHLEPIEPREHRLQSAIGRQRDALGRFVKG